MMFLLRTAFWLSLVVMLIPVDDGGSNATALAGAAQQPIGAIEAANAAQEALSDVGGFCARNPTACAVGARIGTTFLLKARTGARMVYEFIDGKIAADTTDHGTLTPNDLAPVWHGQTQTKRHDV